MTKYMKVINGKINNVSQPCPRLANHPETGSQFINLHLATDDVKREYGFYPIVDNKPVGVIKSSEYVLDGSVVNRVYVVFTESELEEKGLEDFRGLRSQLLPHLNWTQNDITSSGLTVSQRVEMAEYIQRLLQATELSSTEAVKVFKTCPEWFKLKQYGEVLSIIENGVVEV